MSHVSVRHGLKAAALVAGISLSLAACGSSDGGGSGNSGSGSGSGDLTIGASLPLTGDLSEPGSAAKQGYHGWQAPTNSGGGLPGKKGNVKRKDDASNRNTIISDHK